MRLPYKLSYQVQSLQEFCAVHQILEKFNYSPRDAEFLDVYGHGKYIAVALNTKEQLYGFVYGGPMAYSEYTECKNLSDLCIKMETQQNLQEFARVMNMTLGEARDAFDAIIRVFGNSTSQIMDFTKMLHNTYCLDDEDFRRHDGWLDKEMGNICGKK